MLTSTNEVTEYGTEVFNHRSSLCVDRLSPSRAVPRQTTARASLLVPTVRPRLPPGRRTVPAENRPQPRGVISSVPYAAAVNKSPVSFAPSNNAKVIRATLVAPWSLPRPSSPAEGRCQIAFGCPRAFL